MQVHRSALVAHPAERMYALIEAAEDYPAFLPWCAATQVLHRDEQVVVARIDIAWHGARFGFVTRNPKRRPQWMGITLEEGPFNRLEGQWQLTPLAEWGCRIDFSLSYDFASSLVGTLASPVFDRIANRLVDAFIHRADQTALAGGPPGP